MSGNNENNDGCIPACSVCTRGCLNYIFNIPRNIVAFPCRKCFKALPRKIDEHRIAFVITGISCVFSISSWLSFELELSISIFAYILSAIICSGITVFVPRGKCCPKTTPAVGVMDYLVNEPHSSEEDSQAVREAADGAEQPPPEALVGAVEPRQELAAAELVEELAPELNLVNVAAEVHRPNTSSEGSTPVHASSSSNEPQQQAAAPHVVPPSSAEASTPSTSSTPLE